MRKMQKLLLIGLLLVIFSACGNENVSGSDREIIEAASLAIENMDNIDRHEIEIIEKKKDSCTVKVRLTEENSTYIETSIGQMELRKDTKSGTWSYVKNSYEEDVREIDFSPLNGTWTAKYDHPSNYLTENKIPFSFTFSDAGVIQIKNGISTTTTVKVKHDLNQLWDKYLNPTWKDIVPRGTNYETGTMEIVYEKSGLYFLIEFDETNVDKMFDSPCQLRIDYRQIIFYDALVANNCRLTKK